MTRPKLQSDLLTTLTAAARDLAIFSKPSPEQRKARSVFWTHFSVEGVLPPPSLPDLATALRFGGDSRIQKWWTAPGFPDWFWNNEEFKQRVEFIASLALDALEDVLCDPNARTADKLTAAKMVLEAGGKFPGRKNESSERFLDEKISLMSKAELEAFISGSYKKLTSANLTLKTDDNTMDVESSPID